VSRPKILVVDDDTTFLHFITEVLIGAGYDVRGTEQPLSAATLAEEFKPHLILLDIAMPGKDGLQLADEFRSNEQTAHTPRVFLTARPARETMPPAKEAGGVAYLQKPVKTSTLLWTVKAILNKA
jgi:DNA-binding response OmpR family regulator